MAQSLTVIQMLPALQMGGVEKGTLETSRNLVEHGHRSIVISDGGQMLETLKQQGGEHYAWPVGAKRLRTLKWIKPVAQLIKDSNANVLHLRSRLPAWIGYLAWKSLPKDQRPALITTVHGPYSVNAYSAVMTKGQKVVAVSGMIKSYILNNYPKVPEERIQVIHRGVDPAVYPYGYQTDEAWLQNWPYPVKDRFVVTLPGRLTAWKGQMDFIDIIQGLKKKGIPVLGLMVGDAHPRRQQFKTDLQNKVNASALEQDIIFTGHRNDLREILSISDVILSLSTQPEAFGRTTLEALAIGKPVAAYDHGGVAEQLTALLPEGKIKNNDINGMVELLAQWQKQPPTVKEGNPFTLQRMLSDTLRIYEVLSP